jgi:hypothetical protein
MERVQAACECLLNFHFLLRKKEKVRKPKIKIKTHIRSSQPVAHRPNKKELFYTFYKTKHKKMNSTNL